MSDYRKFLSSYAWRKTRERIIKRDNGECVICQREAEEVHHHEYLPEIMEGIRDDLLVSLCKGCHHRIEFDGKTKRIDLKEKRKVFDSLQDIHRQLREKGVDVVWSMNLVRKKPVYEFRFPNNYWKNNFVCIDSVAWSLLTGIRIAHDLHMTRGTVSRLREKGIKLTYKKTKRLAAVVKVEDETCFVYQKNSDIFMPWNKFDELLNKPRKNRSRYRRITYKFKELN